MKTTLTLAEALKNRKSPRAFSEEIITEEMIGLLFEAARWAPSAMNEQPWLYFYAGKDNPEAFNKVLGVLTGINPQWAKNAQYLIVSVAKKFYDYQGRPNQTALHDLGAANVLLAVQAAHLGFQAHQMGGFDKDKAAEILGLDREKYEPVTVIAVGFQGSAEQLPEELKKRELAPRTRKSVEEFATRISS